MKTQPTRSGIPGWVIPLLAVLVGAGLLVGGYVYHSRTVYSVETIEIPPPPPILDPFTGEPIGPPMEATTETVDHSSSAPESNLVLEVTRGGVERTAAGRIERIVRPAGALCPT
jgi:hypothetical protein